MSVGVNVALIALAARRAQARKLAERLHDEGATSPARARTLSEDEARLMRSLPDEGVVVEASPGAFYVDPDRYAWWTSPERAREDLKTVLVVTLVVLALLGALAAGVVLAR